MRKTHGMSTTPIYYLWQSMLKRCRSPKNRDYSLYGGRGITVCYHWLSFENFYADMGDKPEGRSIDRIDNNGNYSFGNCRWATGTEQSLNKRLYRNNKSGLSGVHRRRGKWRVSIGVNRQRFHLGVTDDFFEACCLRKAAEARFA